MKRVLLVIFMMGASFFAAAQEHVVSGKVTAADDGSALPGVNVVLKGTTFGTVTNAEGTYRLTLPSSGGILVFSFIGLQTQEVSVSGQSTIDTKLTMDVTQLSEVVVTGVGRCN